MRILTALAFLATIPLANWLIVAFGVVPVGFGLSAPAGVYAAGLAFTLRDAVHERWGRSVVALLIGAGGLVSLLVAPQYAVPSAVAFWLSEGLDLAVYTPLRRRSLAAALFLSNLAGLVADSAVFLWLAFGSLEYLAGQIVGKLWITLAAAGIAHALLRRALSSPPRVLL